MTTESEATKHRIIPNYDPHALWAPVLNRAHRRGEDGPALAALVEAIVDEHARAGIDTIAQCIFEGFRTPQLACATADPYDVGDHPIIKGSAELIEILRNVESSGRSLVQILVERCHARSMKFLAGLRMNDRHAGSGANWDLWPRVQRMVDDHPEWELTEFRGALDFKHEGVRDAVLAFIAETLDTHDVDGLEFDWPRWYHVFKASEAVAHAPRLTDFTRKARALLDEAARRRGCDRLTLGVRVAHTLEECRFLGYDLAAWIGEGLVDYVAPSDFFHTDFNAPVEQFVALTAKAGGACKVYPSIHVKLAWDDSANKVTRAHCRAAARNFYAAGAHGLSPYNYQEFWGGMWGETDQDGALSLREPLSTLAQLRDDAAIAAEDRHYVYLPLWGGGATEGHGPTGGYHNDRILLDCREGRPQGAYTFRIAEDLSDPSLSATLSFKVTSLIETDELQVQINGAAIPASAIERTWHIGQSPKEGRPLGRYFQYRMDLICPPAQEGENTLTLRVTHVAGMPSRVLNAQEFEVFVKVGASR